ncbi:YgaP family membrane protein [Halorientalis halophila]|uniref:YgaP family membrane protein n=1 Tax=Halorientalis halophila TaxID=3108499 RepID=UPI00300972ED
MIEKNVGGADRKGRALLAIVLTVVAVTALQRGNRGTGIVAGLAALGFGFNATTCFCGLNAALGVDTTDGE